MSETGRTLEITLPSACDELVGVRLPFRGIATFVCHPGPVEIVNGVKIRYPALWKREAGSNGDR